MTSKSRKKDILDELVEQVSSHDGDPHEVLEAFFLTMASKSRQLGMNPKVLAILNRLAGECKQIHDPVLQFRADGKMPAHTVR